MKYAVFANGIRQYKVQEGEEILVDRLELADKTVTFDQVLLISDEGKIKLGTPTVAGAKISAEVVGEQKGEKIEVVKYKSKSRYRKHTGHRHQYTRLKISKITS
jgi:large subunit ribosomal protein L21